MPESLRDDVGVFTGGDEERDVGVAEVVGPHRFADRIPDRRVPEAATEDAQVEWSSFGGGEDEVLVARVRVEMFGEFVGEEGGEADGAACGGCLCRFLDPELAAREVEPVGAQYCEFSGAETAVGTGEDKDPIAGRDGFGEVFDFVDAEEALLGLLDAGEGDAAAR